MVKKTIIIVILLLAVGVGVWAWSGLPRGVQSGGTNTPPTTIPGWKTATDPVSGVAFQYPETLGAKYIGTVDWPPKVSLSDAPFSCTEAGVENAPAGKTEKVMVNGTTYCVTKETQGAAGSIYTLYAYALPKNGKVVIFTFALRFSQCDNYEAAEKTTCETERTSFDINSTVDRMAGTAKW